MQGEYYIAAVLFALLWWVVSNQGQPPPLEQKRKYAVVSFVIDGDTIILKGAQPNIRLWGVDAAEKGRSGFYEAKKSLIAMVHGVRVSYIEIDRDRYKRIVARVWLPDGQEVNRLMIEQGGANEYCRFSKGFYGQC